MVELQTERARPFGLLELCRSRWAIPVLAALHPGGGAKFVKLASDLGCGRESLSRTLRALEELDYVMRNPGHGHPLRPEWVLTPWGQGAAPACARLEKLLATASGGEACRRRWSLAALLLAGRGLERFGELSEALPGVTARALAQTLKELCAAGLVERRVLEDEHPPRAVYAPTRAGRRLLPAIEDLARAAEAGG
jgi:DNA-binding HxlR family transcriptional regulator